MTPWQRFIKSLSNSRVWIDVLATLWCISAICLVFVVDVIAEPSKAASDFNTSFYVAGYMVAHGLSQHLYASTSTDVMTGYFNTLTHNLFPSIPPVLVARFMYSPLVALLMVPFVMLGSKWALVAWQAVSIVCLVIVACVSGNRTFAGKWRAFAYSFCFLPILATLWIGQLGIVFGVLPLALGYHFSRRAGGGFAAGLIFSVSILKPQIFPCAAMAAIALNLVGARGCFAGLVVGAACMFGMMIGALGLDTFLHWVGSLAASEKILSGTNLWNPVYLVSGLPGTVIASLPPETRAIARLPVYGFGGLLLLLACGMLWRIARSEKLPSEDKPPLVMLVSTLALPLFSPHLLLYDLCVFLVAALLPQPKRFTPYLLVAMTVTSLYVLATVVFPHDSLPVMLLPGALLLLQISLWYELWRRT